MPQFFVDQEFGVGSKVEIRGSDAKHISRVLRLTAGNWVVLSDGKGRSFRAMIKKSRPNVVLAEIEREIVRKDSANPPSLAIAMVKPERFEWTIQKAVELGCRHIMPFRSARTIVRNAKLKRWEKITLEAAKQSGLPFRPTVEEPVEFTMLCEIAKAFGQSVLFYEGEDEKDIRSFWQGSYKKGVSHRSLLIIGPEGGFTDKEVRQARSSGIETLGLGPQILRVETAAIASLTIWQYESGNMDAT